MQLTYTFPVALYSSRENKHETVTNDLIYYEMHPAHDDLAEESAVPPGYCLIWAVSRRRPASVPLWRLPALSPTLPGCCPNRAVSTDRVIPCCVDYSDSLNVITYNIDNPVSVVLTWPPQPGSTSTIPFHPHTLPPKGTLVSATIAPHITLSAITAAGKQLRASLDDTAETAGQLAIVVFQLTNFEVELARMDNRYSMLISSDKPIERTVCDQWAASVGAPLVTWTTTYEGRHWEAQWSELHRCLKPLPDIELPKS